MAYAKELLWEFVELGFVGILAIMQLVADYSTAFRVRFAGPRPAGAALYWRGPVLHDFDGRTWRRPAEVFRTRQRPEYLGEAVHYRVALEATRQRFWFALDLPARSPAARVFLTYDYQLLAADPVMIFGCSNSIWRVR